MKWFVPTKVASAFVFNFYSFLLYSPKDDILFYLWPDAMDLENTNISDLIFAHFLRVG